MACCGRFVGHYVDRPAPDAERLMRSRFSAYVTGATEYLLATWHPSRRPKSVELSPGIEWLGLDVRAFRALAPDRAEVEFVARYALAGRAGRMHETSRFVAEDGRWFYVDGVVR